MSGSHQQCSGGHVCQEHSGRVCIEVGCDAPAGTWWGPYWCPEHDKERLDRISGQLEALVTDREVGSHEGHAVAEKPTLTAKDAPRFCRTCEVEIEPRVRDA